MDDQIRYTSLLRSILHEDCQLIGDYKDIISATDKVKIQCKNGHTNTTVALLVNGKGCKLCTTISKFKDSTIQCAQTDFMANGDPVMFKCGRNHYFQIRTDSKIEVCPSCDLLQKVREKTSEDTVMDIGMVYIDATTLMRFKCGKIIVDNATNIADIPVDAPFPQCCGKEFYMSTRMISSMPAKMPMALSCEHHIGDSKLFLTESTRRILERIFKIRFDDFDPTGIHTIAYNNAIHVAAVDISKLAEATVWAANNSIALIILDGNYRTRRDLVTTIVRQLDSLDVFSQGPQCIPKNILYGDNTKLGDIIEEIMENFHDPEIRGIYEFMHPIPDSHKTILSETPSLHGLGEGCDICCNNGIIGPYVTTRDMQLRMGLIPDESSVVDHSHTHSRIHLHNNVIKLGGGYGGIGTTRSA